MDTNGDFVFRSFRAGQLVCLLFPQKRSLRSHNSKTNETVNKKRCDLAGVHVESSVAGWATLKQKEFPRVGDLCSETQRSLTVN